MEIWLSGAVFALYLAAQILAVIAGSRLPHTGRSVSLPPDRRSALIRPSGT